ncbi:putative membrane protein [Lachnospiraceae bacterium JC7]|nr:putative membrane protein [Lachnospiraceae bacterium JC7]
MQKFKELYLSYKEIINYLIVGGLTTVVSLSVYYISVSVFLDPKSPVQLQIANIISWVAAVTFAYFTNRRFVFGSSSASLVTEAGKFYASRVSTLLMDMGIMFLTVSLLHMNDKIAKLIVQVVVTVANYILSKYLVFNNK